jgi:hypothetical protein
MADDKRLTTYTRKILLGLHFALADCADSALVKRVVKTVEGLHREERAARKAETLVNVKVHPEIAAALERLEAIEGQP